MKRSLQTALAVLLAGGILMFGLSGCFSPKYNVDYGGNQDAFSNAKASYREGEKVVLYYPFITTDTDYTFYVDGKAVNPDYREDKGYILSFTMPAHDVSVRVEMRNSMEYIPETDAVLTFDSFDGGGPEYSVTVDDPSIVAVSQTQEYANPNHGEMEGSGYTVYIRFTGLTPGTTTAKVACRSPIADNFDAVYEITVDENLAVTVTETEHTDIDTP